MHARNAARVLPEPVGAEIRVAWLARMCGQPCSCGSVALPNFARNHSRTTGCAQASEAPCSGDISLFYPVRNGGDEKAKPASMAACLGTSRLTSLRRNLQFHHSAGAHLTRCLHARLKGTGATEFVTLSHRSAHAVVPRFVSSGFVRVRHVGPKFS